MQAEEHLSGEQDSTLHRRPPPSPRLQRILHPYSLVIPHVDPSEVTQGEIDTDVFWLF